MSREPISAVSERLALFHLSIGVELLGHLWLSRYTAEEIDALHNRLTELRDGLEDCLERNKDEIAKRCCAQRDICEEAGGKWTCPVDCSRKKLRPQNPNHLPKNTIPKAERNTPANP